MTHLQQAKIQAQNIECKTTPNHAQKKTWVKTQHGHKSITKARYVGANIKRDGFWGTCANFVHMVELILMVFNAFDGKQPCIGKA
jgi:hypothetical protein